MTRLIWLTDIHLNFLPADEAAAFLDSVAEQQCDGVLITGDIGESHNVERYLLRLSQQLDAPIYFVLGNHDFYHGSIKAVRDAVQTLCETHPRLVYLTRWDEPLAVTPTLGIVGHDGWADARLGSYERSMVRMTDFNVIEELRGYSKEDRRAVLQAMGDEAAKHIRWVLPQALERFENVLLLTHVPPLRAACWHEGQLSDEQWAPHFTCQAMGDAILETVVRFPNRKVTVLCGHTHGAGACYPTPNLEVLTGGAEYTRPLLQRVFVY